MVKNKFEGNLEISFKIEIFISILPVDLKNTLLFLNKKMVMFRHR